MRVWFSIRLILVSSSTGLKDSSGLNTSFHSRGPFSSSIFFFCRILLRYQVVMPPFGMPNFIV